MTRKITRGLLVDAELDDCLFMGNLDSLRDWGMLGLGDAMADAAAGSARDFVIATGRRRVCAASSSSAQQLGWGPMQWDGEGTAEVGRCGDTGAVVSHRSALFPSGRG